jgi:hypothetical protein
MNIAANRQTNHSKNNQSFCQSFLKDEDTMVDESTIISTIKYQL